MAHRWRLAPPAFGKDPDEVLFEALAGLQVSWTSDGEGTQLWAEGGSAEKVREALRMSGLAPLSEEEEPDRDWVSESAALRRPVPVGRYLLDPHDGERATSPGRRTRLSVPAARAFGTGSHESTRLAVRLLLQEIVPGASVLDVGCGAGTLAFVAASEGASPVVAFDLDPDAAFATRRHGAAGGPAPRSVRIFAGPLAALRGGVRFDIIVANMLEEELAPLLISLAGLLETGGLLLTSGQLRERETPWLLELSAAGFGAFRIVAENEWLGVAATRV